MALVPVVKAIVVGVELELLVVVVVGVAVAVELELAVVVLVVSNLDSQSPQGQEDSSAERVCME